MCNSLAIVMSTFILYTYLALLVFFAIKNIEIQHSVSVCGVFPTRNTPTHGSWSIGSCKRLPIKVQMVRLPGWIVVRVFIQGGGVSYVCLGENVRPSVSVVKYIAHSVVLASELLMADDERAVVSALRPRNNPLCGQ